MPLAIRELVIKVTIEEKKKSTWQDSTDLQQLRKDIVNDCVAVIMSKLEQTTER